MKASLRSQFFFLLVPFAGALVALLFVLLGPYFAVRRNVLEIERELGHTLAIQQFADAFSEQTREYADYIVTEQADDIEESARALNTSRQTLAALRHVAADDGSDETKILRQITAEHDRVTELGATITNAPQDQGGAYAARIMIDELLPLVTSVSSRLDQELHEHQTGLSTLISKVSVAIDSSKVLQLGEMQEGIEDLDSHVAEVLESAAYQRAIETELRGVWAFFLSPDPKTSTIAADHERVHRSYAAWRLAVKSSGGATRFGGPRPVDELRFVDDLHHEYLGIHAQAVSIIALVKQGSDQRARDLLMRHLEFESTTIAAPLQKYTVHETEVARENLKHLKTEAEKARRMLLVGALAILLIALGIPWFLSRKIIKPILDLQQAALRIGRGDLETRIEVSSTIELASLGSTFNDMAGELKASRNKDLEKSEERFQLVARATVDMIWDWDVRADRIWLGERFQETFGPEAGVTIARLLECVHPDDRQRVERGLHRVMRGTDLFWSGEYRMRRVDGSYAQMSDRGSIVRDAGGDVVRMIGAMTDITERKDAEQAIAGLHRQQELLLNSVGDGIIGLDRDGHITSVNPAGAVMLGVEEHHLLGTAVREVVHRAGARGDAQAWEDSLIRTTLREGTLQSSDTETFWRADGSSFPADCVSNPMLDENGTLLGSVLTFRDITHKHEVNRLKSEFVSTVSHELRTPLTSIRGALGLLSGGLLGNVSVKAQRMLGIAVSNTDRLVRLINDILDVERIESETMKMSREVVVAFELMNGAAEGLQSMADAAGVRLVVEPATGSILGDPDRLMQTLQNLVGNAIKFSPRDTTVTVSAATAGDTCTFRIADEGRGLPPAKLELIFERFQQLDASDSRDKGGSGLGLAICRSIVNGHGGRIWAENSDAAGAVFQFTIPSVIAQAAPDVEAKPRTLMVCQESDSAMPGIVKMLQGQGFNVLRCFESEITARVAETQPDAIVLDLASNGGHGWQVVEALKSEPETRHVPIVVATLQSPDSWENYAASVASWVRRPFGSADLLDAVTEACRAPSILVVEDDVDLGRVMTAILQNHGIRTFHAMNGQQAVELCRQHEPSLIVLDLILPDMDGFAVVSSLKESETLRRIPLLVYSGMDVGTEDKARLRLGPTEFLTKSRATLDEFESRVVRLLDTITAEKAEASRAA
jgi:PAS domain S-box-containing protein